MEIGARLRKIRRLQQRTLQDVADRSDITKSLLSKIENGKTSPPVATLTRIADALGVKVAQLLADGTDSTTVHTPAEALAKRNMTATDKGYSFFSFASRRTDKAMQVYLFEAQRGKIKPQALSHSGEEFIYVLDGEMQYTVGNVQYRLGPGDSLYFDAEEDHDLQPISKTVRFLAVFTERKE